MAKSPCASCGLRKNWNFVKFAAGKYAHPAKVVVLVMRRRMERSDNQ